MSRSRRTIQRERTIASSSKQSRPPLSILLSPIDASRAASEIEHDRWERSMAHIRHATCVVVGYGDGKIDFRVGCLCGWRQADESSSDRAATDHLNDHASRSAPAEIHSTSRAPTSRAPARSIVRGRRAPDSLVVTREA